MCAARSSHPENNYFWVYSNKSDSPTGFQNNSLLIKEGDCVVIDVDNEATHSSCHHVTGLISQIYDLGIGMTCERYRGVVRYLLHRNQVTPKNRTLELYENELFLPTDGGYETSEDISLLSIANKCTIRILPPSENKEYSELLKHFGTQSGSSQDLFIRFAYSVKRKRLIELSPADREWLSEYCVLPLIRKRRKKKTRHLLTDAPISPTSSIDSPQVYDCLNKSPLSVQLNNYKNSSKIFDTYLTSPKKQRISATREGAESVQDRPSTPTKHERLTKSARVILDKKLSPPASVETSAATTRCRWPLRNRGNKLTDGMTRDLKSSFDVKSNAIPTPVSFQIVDMLDKATVSSIRRRKKHLDDTDQPDNNKPDGVQTLTESGDITMVDITCEKKSLKAKSRAKSSHPELDGKSEHVETSMETVDVTLVEPKKKSLRPTPKDKNTHVETCNDKSEYTESSVAAACGTTGGTSTMTQTNRRKLRSRTEAENSQMTQPDCGFKSVKKTVKFASSLADEFTPRAAVQAIPSSKRRNLRSGSKNNHNNHLDGESASDSTPITLTVVRPSSVKFQHKNTSGASKSVLPNQEDSTVIALSNVSASATVPLPGREYEFNQIFSFVRGKIDDLSGGCMYISGVPGTGKTATVQAVMQSLSEDEEICSDFQFVPINCMKLVEPRQIYSVIVKYLTGQKMGKEQALDLLQHWFNESSLHHTSRASKLSKSARTVLQRAIVLLLDELDLLTTTKQNVLYNLFDWPTKRNCRLIILAIANTLDLPERIMINRVSSRLGLTRLPFQPYTFQQLQRIILHFHKERRNAINFDGEAAQLIARKIAAVSGDARRVIETSKRAAQLVVSDQQNEDNRVTIEHAVSALDELFSGDRTIVCSVMEHIMMKAVDSLSGLEDLRFSNVYERFADMCHCQGFAPANTSQALTICHRLAASRLLLVDHGRYDLASRIRLNISKDELDYLVPFT